MSQCQSQENLEINPLEIAHYNRLLLEDISSVSEDEIQSRGYVVYTLEASIWCILTTNCYKEAVLKAVNLGEDTDTTAAVTGGLAGLIYGEAFIPEEWLQVVARKEDIIALSNKYV